MIRMARKLCAVLALLTLVSHTLLTVHAAKHLDIKGVVECQLCLCQGHQTHGMAPEIVSFAAIPVLNSQCSHFPSLQFEGVVARAFLQRAPPAVA